MFNLFTMEDVKEVLYALVFGVIACVGGAVSYLSSTVSNKSNFIFVDMIVKSLSSGFAGLIIGWIMIYYNYPITITCAISGCAGYFGAEVSIGLIKRFVLKKLDIDEKNG